MAELVEREVRWGDIGVGHVILGGEGRKWTVIGTAVPQQFEYGRTCWFRLRAPKGEERSQPPQRLKQKVTILIDPEAPPIERAWPSGAREAQLLVDELGAQEIATIDDASGEVWCPWMNWGDYGKADALHLLLGHGIDSEGMTLEESVSIHGKAHDLKFPLIGKQGFTHRHVPEDLTIT